MTIPKRPSTSIYAVGRRLAVLAERRGENNVWYVEIEIDNYATGELKPKDARRFSRWLAEAAEWVAWRNR